VSASEPVRLALIGAGSRGATYARYALEFPDRVRIVAVAEPNDLRRAHIAASHGIPVERTARDWREWLDHPRFADGAIIATQDALHAAPTIALAERGYHLLLEKPLAPNEADCRAMIAAVRRAGVMLAVCHVMRYTPYTQLLKRVLDAGTIGEIVSVQHLEPVGFWHQAHSFVRGNWGNEARSSSMLLQKSCHDLDWLRYIVGVRCERVSSFGSLKHFRAEEAPSGATERCPDCPVETDCAYSAPRFYRTQLEAGNTDWPVNVVTDTPTPETLLEALRTGPYGRCVYACDNDVVDHQVVNLEFRGGITASFTMTAFTRARDRETRIFGTRGELYGDGERVQVFDFLSGQTQIMQSQVQADGSILTGHGGGDEGVMRAFIEALETNDPERILSGATQSLESHLMVFAAETARRQRRVVEVRP
jgi:predicted dehydrogenase